MTADRGYELYAVVAILDTMSGGAMRAGDDATLSSFEALCRHWQKMAAAELKQRKAK
jgi:hypothetical protein